MSVVIYSSDYCPFCIKAKSLLQNKSVSYTEHKVDGKPKLRQQMQAKAGRSSVPQIWAGDTHIGGCDELFALERAGKLEPLLKSIG